MHLQLKISGDHYSLLKNHLFPGDGKEAIAIALCGRHNDKNYHCLYVHDIILIPYEDCTIREKDIIQWSTLKNTPISETTIKRRIRNFKDS